MKTENVRIEGIPAILWGEHQDKIVLYVHGKDGCKEEAEFLADIACPREWQVLSFDLPGYGERKTEIARFVPWETVPELQKVYKYLGKDHQTVMLYANSIGAYFSLLAFSHERFEKALFISPILDMEQLIAQMMNWASITPQQLSQQKEIATSFGETLSWQYFLYAKEHPICIWQTPVSILYAGQDQLTQRDTVERFCQTFHADLQIMEDGEHWFHTPQQLAVLSSWIQNELEQAK